MLRYLIPLLLVSSVALAQQRVVPHGYTGGLPGTGETYAPDPLAKIEPPPPLFNGELTPQEVDLIAKALDRLAIEIKEDEKTVSAASSFRAMLLANPHETLADLRALPTIGLALGRATNVEVDRTDENGVKVIDNAASRAASKPYCDLLKKLNPQAGCVKW